MTRWWTSPALLLVLLLPLLAGRVLTDPGVGAVVVFPRLVNPDTVKRLLSILGRNARRTVKDGDRAVLFFL